MFARILIANRGEIARRIMRTARAMGVGTVAVHSEADACAPFVAEADAAVCIGRAAARDSYLRHDKILEAARRTGAEAIHPGYGFLSENADFAQAVIDAGLAWIGPRPASIRAMGAKDAAKRLMRAAGVPTTPGTLGEDQSAASLARDAEAIGYPVLIKAVAGGGGKGMRRVDAATDFADALAACKREAAAAFGDDRVLLETYVASPRHIEVQVFGDTHGTIVHLFERDCSLQRRHQKVIEEAPVPGMDEPTRASVCAAAVAAAKAVDYVGAGTVEFIADARDGLRADRIWFMEMNTRLQVEHAVTEAVTGQDLVEWQLRVAAGEPLPLAQDALRLSGWAMEARLYAENPATGFLPSIGRLDRLRLPTGIRVDSGVEECGEVTPFYDPMIAKLIATGRDRAAAATALAKACREVEVWPVRTNAAMLARALAHPEFVAGAIDTGFLERHADTLVPASEPPAAIVAAAAAALVERGADGPWTALPGFRNTGPREDRVLVEIDGATMLAQADADPRVRAVQVGDGRVLFLDGEGWAFGAPRPGATGSAAAADGDILAPMPGRIVAVDVAEGERVAKGRRLVVLEAMKMEQALLAPFDGRVVSLETRPGAQVRDGARLARIEPEGD